MKKYNWQYIHEQLMYHFRLKSLPVAVKYYQDKKVMMAIPGVALAEKQCVPCLAVGRAAQLGVATGITTDHFNYDYCRTVNGFKKRNDKWFSAEPFVDRWNKTKEAAKAHHCALIEMPYLNEGFVAAPLQSGIIKEPDACVLYANPEQAFWILASTMNEEYKKINFTFVGESTCNDAWIKTTVTGDIGIGIGSNGERIYGGLPQDELMISMKADDIIKAIEGAVNMKKGRERLAYPIPAFSLVGDVSCVKNSAFDGF